MIGGPEDLNSVLFFISGCDIGDEDVGKILETLKENTSITSLNLKGLDVIYIYIFRC